MERYLSASIVLAASLGFAAVSALAQTPVNKVPSPRPNNAGGPVPAGSRVKDECDQGINICNLKPPSTLRPENAPASPPAVWSWGQDLWPSAERNQGRSPS